MGPIYAIAFARSLCWHAIFFFLPLILRDRGLDGLARGAVLAAVPLGGVLFALFAGALADRWSPRPVIAAGLALLALFFAALAGVGSAWVLVPAFLLGGVGLQLAQVGSEAYVLKRVRAGREGGDLGGMVAANVLAMAVGLALGGVALERASAARLAGAAALGCAALAIVAARRLAPIEAVAVAQTAYADDLRRPGVLGLLVFCVLTRLHWGAESASYAPFLSAAYGLDRAQAGLYMAGPIVLLAVASLAAGSRLDRGAARPPLLAVGALVSGLGHVAFTLPGSVWGSLAFRGLHEVAEAVLLVAVMREVAALSPRERQGGSAGAITLAGNLASALGALAASPLGARFGEALPNQVGGALMMLGALAVPLFARALAERRDRDPSGGTP